MNTAYTDTHIQLDRICTNIPGVCMYLNVCECYMYEHQHCKFICIFMYIHMYIHVIYVCYMHNHQHSIFMYIHIYSYVFSCYIRMSHTSSLAQYLHVYSCIFIRIFMLYTYVTCIIISTVYSYVYFVKCMNKHINENLSTRCAAYSIYRYKYTLGYIRIYLVCAQICVCVNVICMLYI